VHEPIPKLNLKGLNWTEFRSPRSERLKRYVNTKVFTRRSSAR
jgi:hypothetical protein